MARSETKISGEATRQPLRVIVGHCPHCRQVVLVENHHEAWPPVECSCGWWGGTDQVEHRVRFEQGGTVEGQTPTGRVRS